MTPHKLAIWRAQKQARIGAVICDAAHDLLRIYAAEMRAGAGPEVCYWAVRLHHAKTVAKLNNIAAEPPPGGEVVLVRDGGPDPWGLSPMQWRGVCLAGGDVAPFVEVEP